VLPPLARFGNNRETCPKVGLGCFDVAFRLEEPDQCLVGPSCQETPASDVTCGWAEWIDLARNVLERSDVSGPDGRRHGGGNRFRASGPNRCGRG
jgi:hypothetical protein